MNKYIIISFILCVVIIYLYLKNPNREHFEVPTTDVDVIQNLTNVYVDPSTPITFNNIKVKSVIAESMNDYPIQLFTPVQPINDGSIMRLGDKLRGNGWKNYTVNIPSYLSMTFSGTLSGISKGQNKNLLLINSYVQSQISENPTLFNFSDDVSGTTNRFISFYGPFDETRRLSGLKYNSGTGTIIGFIPSKLYKIDCDVTLYMTSNTGNTCRLFFQIKNIDKILCETQMTAHHDGMTHSFRLITYCVGITYDGIELNIGLSESGGNSVVFWNYNDFKGRPNTNVAIMVEEIRNGL